MFKVGDRVRYTTEGDNIPFGTLGSVVVPGSVETKVDFDHDGRKDWIVGTDELELVTAPAPRTYVATLEPGMPHGALARKATPIATGFLAYFPHSCAEVAKVSYIGNDQHNPGQPLHWARGKSMDQPDAAVRHIMDYLIAKQRDPNTPVPRDEKGNSLLAQAIWRLSAQNELDIERELEKKGK